MPTYEFKNTETDEVFEKLMSYDDKVKYLEDNPHIKTYYSKGPNIDYDGGGSVLKKAGDGWKEVTGLEGSEKDQEDKCNQLENCWSKDSTKCKAKDGFSKDKWIANNNKEIRGKGSKS